jgi:hypothetical protein
VDRHYISYPPAKEASRAFQDKLREVPEPVHA